MTDQAAQFFGGQVEGILPDVTLVNITVLLNFFVIGLHRIVALVQTKQSFVGKRKAVHIVGPGRIVYRIGQPPVFIIGLDRQQGMAEHGGRVVHVIGGKDKTCRFNGKCFYFPAYSITIVIRVNSQF